MATNFGSLESNKALPTNQILLLPFDSGCRAFAVFTLRAVSMLIWKGGAAYLSGRMYQKVHDYLDKEPLLSKF